MRQGQPTQPEPRRAGRPRSSSAALRSLLLREQTARAAAEAATETLAARERALRALHEVAVAAGGVLDPAALAQLVVDSARDLLAADSAGLCWWYDEEGLLRSIAENDPILAAQDRHATPGVGLMGLAYESGRPVVVEDYPAWADASAWAVARGLKSGVGVPLRVGERSLGALVVRSYSPRTFRDDHVQVLTLLAAQVAPLLEAARLHAESERRRAEAEALAELARQAAMNPDADRLVGLACEQAARLGHAEYAAIALRQPDNTVGWRGSWGTRSELARASGRAIGRGPVGLAITEKRTIVAERLGENPEFPADLLFNRAEGARTVVTTPLVTREGPIGALLLGWRRDVAVTPAQLRLAEMVAGYAAVILDNAHSYAESERGRAEAEALAELVRQGATEDDPERVVQLVCEHACRLVGADYAGVSLTEADGTRLWHGLSGNRAESWQVPTRGLGTGATAQALAAGRTIVMERLDERPDASQIHTREGGRTVLATPLLGRDGLTGALHLGWRSDVTPTQDQVRLAEALASYASTILERARAYASLAARAAELAASEARMRALHEAVACGLLVHDASGAIVHANAAAEEILGMDFERMRGHGTEKLWGAMREDGSAIAAEERPGRVALRTGQPARKFVLCMERPDGEPRWLQVDAVPVLGEDGTPIQVVSSFIDITERKRAEEALEQQALHDALTGLPNRVLLRDRLAQSLAAARRDDKTLALLLLDLDRFKEINDTLGHQAGDELLRQVAQRLGTALRSSDTVARLGGDEFAVLLPVADAQGAVQVGHKLLRTFERPFTIEGQGIKIGASIGIALYPAHGDAYETLLRRADIAMYQAKRGLKGCAFYAAEQDGYSPGRLTLVGELHTAIEQGQLLLHYQPKIECRTGRVVGVEALVRWQHPERGLLPPDQFIPLAEQTGLIGSLAEWVLGAALGQCAAWRRAGLELPVAVNLSTRNLHDARLPDVIAELLAARGVSPAQLELEITESALMTDPTRAEEGLRRLRAMGLRIAIDDFGTGQSSLAHLKRLLVDVLKIDKSFVLHMSVDQGDRAIVRAIVELGHSLGLEVLAEGVEDQDAWEELQKLGCDAAQGYYLSRPLPAAELERWLQGPPLLRLARRG